MISLLGGRHLGEQGSRPVFLPHSELLSLMFYRRGGLVLYCFLGFTVNFCTLSSRSWHHCDPAKLRVNPGCVCAECGSERGGGVRPADRRVARVPAGTRPRGRPNAPGPGAASLWLRFAQQHIIQVGGVLCLLKGGCLVWSHSATGGGGQQCSNHFIMHRARGLTGEGLASALGFLLGSSRTSLPARARASFVLH